MFMGGGTSRLGSRQLVQERGAAVQGRVGAGSFGEGQPLSPGAECLFEQAAVAVKSWPGVQAVEAVAGEADGIVYESRD